MKENKIINQQFNNNKWMNTCPKIVIGIFPPADPVFGDMNWITGLE